MTLAVLLLLTALCLPQSSTAFQVAVHHAPSVSTRATLGTRPTRLFAESADESADEPSSPETKVSLEEKMKSWEASEEEIRDASLMGVVPGQKTDGFDIGLYVAFPFMIIGSLMFALFPFVMDKIDVSSVGPPPTV